VPAGKEGDILRVEIKINKRATPMVSFAENQSDGLKNLGKILNSV